ncbi:MAG: hypothetical protein AAFP19_05470, partial [Bacteroidota bacterium]
ADHLSDREDVPIAHPIMGLAGLQQKMEESQLYEGQKEESPSPALPLRSTESEFVRDSIHQQLPEITDMEDLLEALSDQIHKEYKRFYGS